MLVAGGLSADQNILTRAEVYNPDTLTWERTRDLNEPRIAHTATLLTDGKVLVAGGSNTAELYDPFADTWSTTGSFSTTRGYHSATLIGTTNPLRNPFLSLLLLRESV